jgi:hypothetical protein
MMHYLFVEIMEIQVNMLINVCNILCGALCQQDERVWAAGKRFISHKANKEHKGYARRPILYLQSYYKCIFYALCCFVG